MLVTRPGTGLFVHYTMGNDPTSFIMVQRQVQRKCHVCFAGMGNALTIVENAVLT